VSYLDRLANERRGRLAAQRLLEQKQRELFAANSELARHARSLSDQIVEHRNGLESARHEAEALRGTTTRALSDLERANAAAQTAQRRLWDALETIRDGFALFDQDHRLIAANGAYLSMFGPDAVLPEGCHYDEVMARLSERILPDATAEERQDWQHEMVSRIGQDEIAPKVIDLADGRHFRLMDRHGTLGDLVCLARDITLAVAREAELQEARDRAEAASRAKSAFLANMTHEIRTPMNGVVGMADLLCQTDLTDEQKLCVETIRNSGEALLAIINDVLDYSKIEAQKLRLYPEPFDLERCLHEVILLLQPSARNKGISVLADYDLFLPTRFVGDRGRIRQILTNLMGNAVKFTQSGHVLARVVGIERDDGQFELHVSVEDTGIGIAAEYLEHIFGEFSQVEEQSNRQFEGTGLGLAITRQLVDLMGGQMWVESELGQGSCFGFRIILPAAEPVIPAHAPRRPVLLKDVLIVTDIQLNRIILQRQLETFGLTVAACQSAVEAQALVASRRFDLMVTECHPTQGDCPAFIDGLRAQGIQTPIALVLADTTQAPRRADVHVLAQPVMRTELYRLLERLSYPDAPIAATSVAPAAAIAEPAPKRRMRVLAAEDNRTNQLVFRKMVDDLEIDLMFANNGHEAVDLWQSFQPDLIFMDISMPGMDGREAASAIRAEEARRGMAPVRIVALTAHAMEGDSVSILAAGIDAYLTKPLKKGQLLDALALATTDAVRPPLAPAATDQPSVRS
jgi:signal transduction histidine kinase/DNA-binding response OmpR family regulator